MPLPVVIVVQSRFIPHGTQHSDYQSSRIRRKVGQHWLQHPEKQRPTDRPVLLTEYSPLPTRTKRQLQSVRAVFSHVLDNARASRETAWSAPIVQPRYLSYPFPIRPLYTIVNVKS